MAKVKKSVVVKEVTKNGSNKVVPIAIAVVVGLVAFGMYNNWRASQAWKQAANNWGVGQQGFGQGQAQPTGAPQGLLGMVSKIIPGVANLGGSAGGGAGGGGAGAGIGGGQEGGTVPLKEWCNTGAFINLGPIKSRILGVEKQIINNKAIDVCCSEVVSTEDANQGMKSCVSQDEKSQITWQRGESGQVFKFSESYSDGEQTCSKMFDETGAVVYEGCQ